jgi:hypothetical protein
MVATRRIVFFGLIGLWLSPFFEPTLKPMAWVVPLAISGWGLAEVIARRLKRRSASSPKTTPEKFDLTHYQL